MSKNNKLLIFSFILFVVLLAQGASLGLSDDEAYHWVLSQKSRWGFAYHPPGVVWIVQLMTLVFKPFIEMNSLVMRIGSCLSISIVFYLSLKWLSLADLELKRVFRSGLLILSLAGLFSLGWMIVPDTPLFLGWMFAFYSTWRLCFLTPRRSDYVMLALGIFFALIGKYSGVLVPFSSALCLVLWSKKHDKEAALKLIVTIFVGCVLGLIPTLVWNVQTNWASILYQVSERHQFEFSWIRYLRFILIQMIIAGPVLFFYSFGVFKRGFVKENRISRFIIIWSFPPGIIYFLQPLVGDFKPHWVLIAWLPMVLEFAYYYSKNKYLKLAKFQIIYGLTLTLVVFFAIQQPLIGWVQKEVLGQTPNPLYDVSNDFYGWDKLPARLNEILSDEEKTWKIVGNRYQSASQIAYALKDFDRVVRLPRPIKEESEWNEYGITNQIWPKWPELLRPIIFIGDNRYNEHPAFYNAKCELIEEFDVYRESFLGNYFAKRFFIWSCLPRF